VQILDEIPAIDPCTGRRLPSGRLTILRFLFLRRFLLYLEELINVGEAIFYFNSSQVIRVGVLHTLRNPVKNGLTILRFGLREVATVVWTGDQWWTTELVFLNRLLT